MGQHIHIAGAPFHGGPRSTEGADAPNSLTLPCDECGGSGEICWASFHPDDPRADRFAVCHECDGTGEVDATCDCGSPLDARGYCADCEAFNDEPQCLQCGSPLEDAPCADCVSNVGWLRAEQSAFGMGAK